MDILFWYQIFLFLLLISLFYTIKYLICKYKVRMFILNKDPNATEINIKWTLSGPTVPGKGTMAFKVSYRNDANIYVEFYAATSLLASVYINEEDN